MAKIDLLLDVMQNTNNSLFVASSLLAIVIFVDIYRIYIYIAVVLCWFFVVVMAYEQFKTFSELQYRFDKIDIDVRAWMSNCSSPKREVIQVFFVDKHPR